VRAVRPSGRARRGACAGCSAMEYQSQAASRLAVFAVAFVAGGPFKTFHDLDNLAKASKT